MPSLAQLSSIANSAQKLMQLKEEGNAAVKGK